MRVDDGTHTRRYRRQRAFSAWLGSILILGLVPAVQGAVDVPPAGRTLTLKEAITTALVNNRPIRIQEEEVAYAKADILYARSLFLPQVAGSFGYTRNDAVIAFPPTGTSRKDTGIFTGYKNSNALGFSAVESIYNGGANIATYKQAQLNLKTQEETLRAARLDVAFETKRLFYGLLLAYETKRIAQDLVDQARAHYQETVLMFDQGTASKFDVLQSKVQVSRLMPQLVRADNAVDLIMVEFKKLLTIDLREPVAIDGKLAHTPFEPSREACVREAYARNPRMILKLLGIDIKKWGIEYAKAGWLPQVSGSAAYNYTSDDVADMVNPRHDNWAVGVKVSLALFDGFATKAKVDEAKARYRQASLEKADVSDAIAVDVEDACLNLAEAQAVIDSQKDAVVEAREALRLAEVRYTNGVGINLDVLDAEVALAEVEQSLAQGIYDYLMAAAQLDKTMGRETSGEGSHEA